MAYQVIRKIPARIKNPLVANINRFRVKRVKNFQTPQNLIFYVTDYCNARCSHCFYWKNLNKRQDEMTLDQIKTMIKSLKTQLNMLVITGGEPFIRKDLYEICSAFYQINKTKRINIVTNGLLGTKILDTVTRLVTENPDKRLTIIVSLDGLEDTHNMIRRVPNIWKKDIELIDDLKKIAEQHSNLSLFVNLTMTKTNIHEVKPLSKFVKDELKINFKVNVLRTGKNYYQVPKEILMDYEPEISNQPSVEELEEVYEWMDKETEDLPGKVEVLKLKHSIDMIKHEKPTLKCLAGYNDGVVFPTGKVAICEPTKSFADLKDYNFDFNKLWNSKEAQLMRQQTSECFCLQSCNLLNSMKYDTATLKNLLK
ncbi:MAG: radical SAM protein [Nanoarchaeota archaeon]